MADIVNLNRARKAKAREAAARAAEVNRTRHGRTLAERRRDAEETAARDRLLDGARTAPSDTEQASEGDS